MNYSGFTLKPILPLVLKVLLVIFISSSILAKENSSDQGQTLKVINAVMPAVPPVSRTAAVYLTLQNLTDKTITLNTVETDIAKHAMFHQTIEQNGVAKMQHRDELIIPAKQTMSLVAGSTHIMLMGMKEIPSRGEFQLSLGNAEQKFQVAVRVVDRKID